MTTAHVAAPDPATLARAVSEAERRIRPYIRETYVEPSPVLSRMTGARVFLKFENLQLTGSFKVRGAFNKLLGLSPQRRARGVVTASTGNHGLAVAHVLNHLKLDGTIFVPTNAAPGKLARIRESGARVVEATDNCADAEAAARAYARAHDLAYVPPYNDVDVVAGQGTLGVELARQVPALDDLFIAVGGGGLVAGVAAYLKSLRPSLRVIGCQPANSQVMIESIRAGRIVAAPEQPTLSDGTAGGIEPGSITFPLCRQLVDEFVAVSEDAIRQNLRLVLDQHHTVVEGAAAVAVAALLQRADAVRGRTCVVVLCGGNIDFATLTASCSSV